MICGLTEILSSGVRLLLEEESQCGFRSQGCKECTMIRAAQRLMPGCLAAKQRKNTQTLTFGLVNLQQNQQAQEKAFLAS